MRNNLLQKRAFCVALFVLLLVVVGSKNAFAQTQVATLQHNDTLTAFSGLNAFIQAYEAAVEGDIITLSSGTFTKTSIRKAITIHGAGCTTDTLGFSPTIVTGDFYIELPGTDVYLTIEGVCFQGNLLYGYMRNAKFVKCFWNAMELGGSANMANDVQLINCICNRAEIRSGYNSVIIANSVISVLRHSHHSSTYANVYNSIIGEIWCDRTWSNMPGDNLYLTNCIIGAASLPVENSYANNCVTIGDAFSSSVFTSECLNVDSYSDVFESFDGTFSFDADYSQKAGFSDSFLGSDGTQVGIYGGAMPYDPRPSYLILNRCSVAGRSTIDGKLSVEIEVITNE